jgi:hypothetical protein
MTAVPTTLLCVTHGLWARVDLDADGRRTHAQILRAALDEPAAALRHLLALGPPLQGECGVLLDGLYVRTLDVETRAAELLPEHEVARWLALRAEARSHVPAERAKVACARQGVGFGERHRAVLAIADRTTVDPLAWTLNDAGAKHVWIASPAGLLGEYVEPVIEVWNGATWCGGASITCAISGDAAGSRRWRRRVSSWLATVPHARVRFHGRQSDAAELADPRLRVSGDVVAPEALLERLESVARGPRDELARLQWNFERESAAPAPQAQAESVAAHPAAAEASRPSAPPSAQPVPPGTQPAASGTQPAAPAPQQASGQPPTAVEASATPFHVPVTVAVLLCIALLWIYRGLFDSAQIAAAAESARATRALQADLDLERGRQSALLDALYEEINDDVNLSGVRAEGDATLVTGIALSAPRADAFAQALAQRLAAAGWRVGAAVGSRVELDGETSVWEFALPLQPAAPQVRR